MPAQGTYPNVAVTDGSRLFGLDAAGATKNHLGSAIKSYVWDVTSLSAIGWNSSSTAEGTITWNSEYHTIQVQDEYSDSPMRLGQEISLRVINKSGSTIPKGSVVRIDTAFGSMPTIQLSEALAAGEGRSLGVTTHTVADGEQCRILRFGVIDGITTTGWAVGANLFLSGTTPGAMTTTYAPAYDNKSIVYVGKVLANGRILVDIDQMRMTRFGREWATTYTAADGRVLLGVVPSDATPMPANTTGSPGSSPDYSRADHVHPPALSSGPGVIVKSSTTTGSFGTGAVAWFARVHYLPTSSSIGNHEYLCLVRDSYPAVSSVFFDGQTLATRAAGYSIFSQADLAYRKKSDSLLSLTLIDAPHTATFTSYGRTATNGFTLLGSTTYNLLVLTAGSTSGVNTITASQDVIGFETQDGWLFYQPAGLDFNIVIAGDRSFTANSNVMTGSGASLKSVWLTVVTDSSLYAALSYNDSSTISADGWDSMIVNDGAVVGNQTLIDWPINGSLAVNDFLYSAGDTSMNADVDRITGYSFKITANKHIVAPTGIYCTDFYGSSVLAGETSLPVLVVEKS